MVEYPVIDLRSTGTRLNELRRERGITVEELRISRNEQPKLHLQMVQGRSTSDT